MNVNISWDWLRISIHKHIKIHLDIINSTLQCENAFLQVYEIVILFVNCEPL